MYYKLKKNKEFGICMINEKNEVIIMRDCLSMDDSTVDELVRLLNDEECDPIHLDNVIEDFSYTYGGVNV